MPRSALWQDLAARQAGMLARRQLLALGLGHHYVDAQVAGGRWRMVSDVVVTTVTGVLTREQLMWAGVLHAGPGSAVGGLTALEVHGLSSWHRDAVTILLPKSHDVEPVGGIDFVQTRRPIGAHTGTVGELPVWRVEPAALLVAGYATSQRTAYGLLAAVVQQRLSTPDRLELAIDRMHPLRMAKPFRHHLHDLAGGVQSLAEHDVKRMCRAFGLRCRCARPRAGTAPEDGVTPTASGAHPTVVASSWRSTARSISRSRTGRLTCLASGSWS